MKLAEFEVGFELFVKFFVKNKYIMFTTDICKLASIHNNYRYLEYLYLFAQKIALKYV